MDVFAAPDWHYWIAVTLTPVTVLMVLGTGVGYFMKVVRPRYPKRYQKRQ
jgi:hypothetical protein